MTRIADLELLARTAELGGLSAAARALDLSPAAASAGVKRLEAQWGMPIFVRSTRSLRLSAEGERLLPFIQRTLQAWQEVQGLAGGQRSAQAQLSGELQLALPSDLGRSVLLPWLDEFQSAHPRLALRLHLSDRNSDLLRLPMDMAVRYGPLRSQKAVALPLAPGNRRILVASPAYLSRHGAPATPAELGQREALRFMLSDRVPATWRLHRGGESIDVPVQGMRSSNDGEVVRRWALAGLGIAHKSWLDVAADVQAGLLRPVLRAWAGEPAPLYLVVPGRAQVTNAVRALHQHLVTRLRPVLAALDA